MQFKDYQIKNFIDKYYEDLKIAYEDSFFKDFLSKENYSKRFKYGKNYTSFLLIKKDTQTIVGHIGYKLNNLNPTIKGKIAFRFSTFISSKYRGTGLYSYFMNNTKELLLKNFGVIFIFAWPNIGNLISCLKDKDYLNQFPIITWQHSLNNLDYIYTNPIGYKFEDLSKNNCKLTLSINDRKLTSESFEDLKKTLFDRDNKKYKIIHKDKFFSIIGETLIDKKIYLSIVFIQGISIELVLGILNANYKDDNYIVQIWCDPKDRILQSSLLKLKFFPNGPVFYNGIYELSDKKFISQDFFPSMYNNDAF